MWTVLIEIKDRWDDHQSKVAVTIKDQPKEHSIKRNSPNHTSFYIYIGILRRYSNSKIENIYMHDTLYIFKTRSNQNV